MLGFRFRLGAFGLVGKQDRLVEHRQRRIPFAGLSEIAEPGEPQRRIGWLGAAGRAEMVEKFTRALVVIEREEFEKILIANGITPKKKDDPFQQPVV